MAQFRGELLGTRGAASRLGTKASGLVSLTYGWQGNIRVEVWYDAAADVDRFRVGLLPHPSSGGLLIQTLAEGVLDSSVVFTRPCVENTEDGEQA